jgi:transposase
MARIQQVSKNTIRRIWQDHQLKPHRTKTFKLSRDPKFLEKLTDVVGVYLTPPQNAVVLCVDEKSQIQALDRTQPGLPLKPGRCNTFTHDYKRHGTTTLFAALQVIEGRVIGQCYPRHRHQEFLRFLRCLDSEFPENKALHLILDNYGTHGHPDVRRWLARHPRFVLHFIPTSSSWLNLVNVGSLNSAKRRCAAAPSKALPTWKGQFALLCTNGIPTLRHLYGPQPLKRSWTRLTVAANAWRKFSRAPLSAKFENAPIEWVVIYGTLH